MYMKLREHPQIKIDEEQLEVVTYFSYLGSNISIENRKISQPESTKQGMATVAYVTYGNLTYTA